MRATSSWSRDSERVVNPTRSANRTVTVRRSSVIAPTVSGLPQYPQNRKRSGLSSRHLGQINTAKGGSRSWRSGCGPWATRRVDQARYTLCTLRQPRYRSFIVATAGPSSEAAYVNRQSERAKPFKTTATAHSQAGEAQRSPPPDLGPPPWLRASTATWLPPGPGRRAAASRAGSGRLPPGGPSGKPPASPWTGHRIDRLLTQAVTSGRNLHSRRSTRDNLINANIMDGGNSIRDCASFPATGLHSAESRDPSLASPAGRVRHLYWLNPSRSTSRVSTDLVMSTYAPNCDPVLEGRNLRQLVACVDEIVTR